MDKKSMRENIRDRIKMTMKIQPLKKQTQRRKSSIVNFKTKEEALQSKDFFDFYQIQEKLGEGAHGVVKKCIQKVTGKIFAVKIFSTKDQQMIRVSKRTFQNLKRIQHQSIIQAYWLFINQKTSSLYLVMQYISYPSLQSFIKKNQISEQQAKKIIKKILECIRVIHKHGICHRDIKPQNIMYDPVQNKIKIIDFGVSKYIIKNREELTKEDMWTVTGTLHYKAPQMLNGSFQQLGGGYNELVDLWAAGIILYRLLMNKYPFSSQYTSDLIESICQDEVEFKQYQDKISQFCKDIIRRLLKKDPIKRLNAAQALKHVWFLKEDEKKEKIMFNQNLNNNNANGGMSVVFMDEQQMMLRKANVIKSFNSKKGQQSTNIDKLMNQPIKQIKQQSLIWFTKSHVQSQDEIEEDEQLQKSNQK